jgi:hypothetical protein
MINYNPPISTGIPIKSITGTVKGNSFNTLSSNPAIIVAGGGSSPFISSGYIVPIAFTIRIDYVVATTKVFYLTFDTAIYPFMTFLPNVQGLITGGLMPYSQLFNDYNLNNTDWLSTSLIPNLVLKSNLNDAACVFQNCPWELLYIDRNYLQ